MGEVPRIPKISWTHFWPNAGKRCFAKLVLIWYPQFRKPPPIDLLPDGLFYLVPVWVPGHDLYLVELYDFRLLAHGWVCCPGGLFLNEWDAHGYEGQSNGEVGGADDQLEQIRGGGVGSDRVRETLGGRVVSKPNSCPDFFGKCIKYSLIKYFLLN